MYKNSQVEIDSVDLIEMLNLSPLPAQAKLERVISSLLFLLPASIAAVVLLLLLSGLPTLKIVLIAAGLILINILAVFRAIMTVKRTGYALREHDFVLEKGIFWRRRTIVPFNRVQHIETHRGPIERKLTLATLKLYTAGGAGADLSIRGLEAEHAEKLKNFMLSFIVKEQQYEK